MSTIPPFLTLLGLDAGADLPDIRRAYAKQIKLLDAERQAAQFQALREAREQATSWVKWRDSMARAPEQAGANAAEMPPSSVPVSVPAPVEPALAPEHENRPVEFKQVNAQEIVASFNALIDRLLVKCLRLPDTARCKRELEARLQETDLIPFEAREIFERATAVYLGAGWKPGNDALFLAAIDVFQWAQGKNRLDTFGPVGIHLNRAVTEWTILVRQFEHGDRRNIGLLGRMRDDAPPTEQEMWFYNGALARMMAQMAAVLPIVTNMRNKDPWLVVPQHGVHGHRPQPPTSLPPEAYKAPSRRSWAVALACLPIVIGLAVNGFSHRNDYQAPPPSQPAHPVIINRTAQPPDAGNLNIPDEAKYLQTHVASHMQFNLRKVSGQFPGTGLYAAMIGANGRLVSASTLQSSGNPQFDEAVIQAFHAAAPYPSQVGGKLQYLSFGPIDLQ